MEQNGRKMMYLDENPWAEPPEAVVTKGLKAVSEYFEDIFADARTCQRSSVKIVLVGQEGAGKTSLRQSMKARRPAPTTGTEESTVHVDVENMDVDGVSVRAYDCAGQAAYTGLLQMFLTPRAVFLVVCDARAFIQRSGGEDEHPDADIFKLEELRIFDWLRWIAWRAPSSDAFLVATKCDLVAGMAADVAQRIEAACREKLRSWSLAGMPAVRVEEDVCLTSCVSQEGDERHEGDSSAATLEKTWLCDWPDNTRSHLPSSMLDRVTHKRDGVSPRGASMVLPRSWNIALTFLDALESGRDPVQMVEEARAAGDEAIKVHRGPQTTDSYKGVTVEELNTRWDFAVAELTRRGTKVTNATNALEGALCIREFEGSVVRHEAYVFLDVTWLAIILKPLLNHKDHESHDGSVFLGDTGDTQISLIDYDHITSWNMLKRWGILDPELANVMWPQHADYVLPTLVSLGLAFPLENDINERLVVLLRLSKECPDHVKNDLDEFCSQHKAEFCARWKFVHGVPPGAIEKILTRCCNIGGVRTFWRYGVLVQGQMDEKGVGSFALLVTHAPETHDLEMKVYGDVGTSAPWAALSYGVSATLAMTGDFPGLRWTGHVVCPQHEQEMPLNRRGDSWGNPESEEDLWRLYCSKQATGHGENLLSNWACTRCGTETGGLGAVAAKLLRVADIRQRRGKVFGEVHRNFIELKPRYDVLRPEELRAQHPERFDDRKAAFIRDAKDTLDDVVAAIGELGRSRSWSNSCGPLDGARQQPDNMQLRMQGLQDMLTQLLTETSAIRGAQGRLEEAVAADDGVVGKIDFLIAMLMATRAERIDAPRRACILPPWKFALEQGLSDDEQTPESWKKRLDGWQQDDFEDGKGIFKKRARLFLVCAHTNRLVPCGHNGQGYHIERPRTWFHTAINFTSFALNVAGATVGPIAGANAPGNAVGVLAEQASAAGAERVVSGMQAHLQVETIEDDGATSFDGIEGPQLASDAYDSLRTFVHELELRMRVEIASKTKKAKKERRAPPSSSEFVFFEERMVRVQPRSGSADAQWVLAESEDAWYDAMRMVPVA